MGNGMRSTRDWLLNLKESFTGNATQIIAKQDGGDTDEEYGGAAIELGGQIESESTATATSVTVVDANGKVIYTAAVVAGQNVTVAPGPHGIRGPLSATVAGYGGAGNLNVYWTIKR